MTATNWSIASSQQFSALINKKYKCLFHEKNSILQKCCASSLTRNAKFLQLWHVSAKIVPQLVISKFIVEKDSSVSQNVTWTRKKTVSWGADMSANYVLTRQKSWIVYRGLAGRMCLWNIRPVKSSTYVWKISVMHD